MRDYASIYELTVLSNLESHNAELIKEGKTKEERFLILSSIADEQLKLLNKKRLVLFFTSRFYIPIYRKFFFIIINCLW